MLLIDSYYSHQSKMRHKIKVSELSNNELDDLHEYGYRRRKILKELRVLMNKNYTANGVREKINTTRRVFEYLDTPECIRFMKNHPVFENSAKEKLHCFYHIDRLREAQTWYRRIFGERIPITMENSHDEEVVATDV